MGTIVFEDMSGSIEALFFPEIFNRFAFLLKGDDPLLLSGYIEKTDNSLKIIGQEIMTLEALRQKSVKAVELIMKEDMISKDILEQLQEIVFRYPGDSKLVFRVRKLDGDDITIYANRRFNTVPCPELIREIESVAGIENHRMILNNN